MLPPLKPIPIKERMSVVFVEKGEINVVTRSARQCVNQFNHSVSKSVVDNRHLIAGRKVHFVSGAKAIDGVGVISAGSIAGAGVRF